MNLIQDTIGEQQDWQAYGGEISSLRELNGNLIIKTREIHHKEIRTLLTYLRGDSAFEEAEWLGLDQNPDAYNAGREFKPTLGVGEITGAAP